jgi:hypothetical protein
VISQLLSLSTNQISLQRETKLAKKTSLIQILVESFENFFLEKSLKEKPFFSEFSARSIKELKFKKVRLKRIFIQEDRDRAIASGLMKHQIYPWCF